MSNYTKFTSRETYLAAVKECKEDYRDLMEQIRKSKKRLQEAQRSYSKSMTRHVSGWFWEVPSDVSKEEDNARKDRDYLRGEANSMLGIRAQMKQMSRTQWELQKRAG